MSSEMVPARYNFLPTDTSVRKAEWEKTLREEFELALANLITGTTPEGVVAKRVARGGKEVDFIPGWWFTQQANALFGHLWGMEVVEHGIQGTQLWSKVRITVRKPGYSVEEHRADGSWITTRYDPVEIVKEQFGGSDIKVYSREEKDAKTGVIKHKAGDMIDLADDLKASATDGKKKCFVEFGFGRDVYGVREILDQTIPDKGMLASLYEYGMEAGLTTEEVQQMCVEKNGVPPEKVDRLLCLGLINDLRKLAKTKKANGG